MITLKPETYDLIKQEMESIPDKYQKPFNSLHEGLGVIREEYLELEREIFFGLKEARKTYEADAVFKDEPGAIDELAHQLWLINVKIEAIQVAAMAARIIQELT